MGEKLEVALCMGSSCFARGNNKLLEMLEDLIKARGWEERVSLSGLRCQNLCSEGPNLTIDGKLYQRLDEGAFLDILESRLGGATPANRSSIRLSSVRKTIDRKGN